MGDKECGTGTTLFSNLMTDLGTGILAVYEQ